MADKSKAEIAAALLTAGIPRASWSVPEFCARHGISPGFYRKLKSLGLGPHETHILDRILITVGDEAAWLRARREHGAASVAENEHNAA
jgi:hypothetical protein